MQAQAQFTIHSLNDVVTSATAPTNPYKGQLWMKSSVTPPVLFTYNGSSWVEANGTSTLRSNVTTLTTKQATLESNLNGLTSTVSSVTTRVTSLEDDAQTLYADVSVLSSNVSILTQTATSIAARVTTNESAISELNLTATDLYAKVSSVEGDIAEINVTTSEISARVSDKVDSVGGDGSSFSWSMTPAGFAFYCDETVLMSINSNDGIIVNGDIRANAGTLSDMTITGFLYFGNNNDYYINANYGDGSYYINLPGFRVDEGSGAVFSGTLSAPSGNIGGFTIKSNAIYKTKTTYSSTTSGVYVGADGIGLGTGNFYVTSAGYLYAKYGNIGGFTISNSGIYNGKQTIYSEQTGIYLGTSGIGLGQGCFYVDKNGYLYSTNGQIGGFSINETWICNGKSAYSDYVSGVYLGTDGIGLGPGNFYVDSAGNLYASSATIFGTVCACDGYLENLQITGRLTFGESEEYYIDPNYNNESWYIYLKNFRVDDTNAYFSGQLSAPTGNIGGFTIAASKIYKTKTTYSSSTTGVYLGTDGIGLGAGKFYVTSAGALTATSANITGIISNVDTDGWGVRLVDNRIELLQSGSIITQIYGSSGYFNARGNATVNGIHFSSLLHVGGDLVCGRCLGISTGNGIYVSGKLALTMGQIKVSSGDTFIGGSSSRYLLIYCGLIVGISESSYSGIYDYTEKTYTG